MRSILCCSLAFAVLVGCGEPAHEHGGHGDDAHAGDAHAGDVHEGDAHAEDGHGADGHDGDGHEGDAHAGDTHADDAHAGDGHADGEHDAHPDGHAMDGDGHVHDAEVADTAPEVSVPDAADALPDLAATPDAADADGDLPDATPEVAAPADALDAAGDVTPDAAAADATLADAGDGAEVAAPGDDATDTDATAPAACDPAAVWTQAFGKDGADQLHAVAVGPNGGGFLAVGERQVAAGNAWLVRTDPAGAVVWQATYGKEGADFARDTVATAAGFVVAGAASVAGKGLDLWLFHVDGAGKLLWEATHHAGGDEAAYAVAPMGSGGAHIVVGVAKAGGLATCFTAAGNLGWQQEFGIADAVFYDVATAGSAVTVAGALPIGNGQTAAWVLRLDPFGTETWAKKHVLGTTSLAVRGVAVLADGGLALAGTATPAGGTAQAWLARTDGNGDLLWQTQLLAGEAFSVALGANGLVVAGAASAAGKAGGWLAQVALDGTQQTGLVTPDAAAWRHGLPLANGGFVVAGGVAAKGLLARTDAFGHATCAASGLCATKAVAACADGNPCTIDGCAAGKCQAGAAPVGSFCGTGTCAVGGACQ